MAKQLLLCPWGGPTNGTGLAHHCIIRTALRSLLPPCVRNYQMTLNGMKFKAISMMTFSVLLCWIYSIGGSKIKVVFAHLSSALEQKCKFIIAERSFKKSMIRLLQPNLRCSLLHQHQRSGEPMVQKECVKCLYLFCDHKILITFICDHRFVTEV